MISSNNDMMLLYIRQTAIEICDWLCQSKHKLICIEYRHLKRGDNQIDESDQNTG